MCSNGLQGLQSYEIKGKTDIRDSQSTGTKITVTKKTKQKEFELQRKVGY